MKVAHVAVVTPHRAGLYETCRDLAAAERRMGIDARIVDPVNEVVTVDRGVPVVKRSFVQDCQVVINHSGLSKDLNKTRLPIIHVLHGRPYGSFLLEQSGKIAIFSYLRRVRNDTRFKLFVTFWPEFVSHWATILPRDRIRCVPAPVDLDRWTPDGPAGYDFHGRRAEINVVCSDMWRDDITPFHVINAFLVYARAAQPNAKLHVYGAPRKGSGWAILKSVLEEAGVLGEAPAGIVKGLQNVYRAASCVITPHRIATRSVREPLACGCNVVMAPGNPYTPYQADPENLEAYAAQIARAVNGKASNRKVAEVYFDARDTAKGFVELLTEVTDGSR